VLDLFRLDVNQVEILCKALATNHSLTKLHLTGKLTGSNGAESAKYIKNTLEKKYNT